VLHGREDVRIEEVEARPLGPGEVRLRIEAALTCGTDLKVYKRGYHARMIVPPAVFAGLSRRRARRGGQFRAMREVLLL
jgi:L-iditol 2-dehydrogenase